MEEKIETSAEVSGKAENTEEKIKENAESEAVTEENSAETEKENAEDTDDAEETDKDAAGKFFKDLSEIIESVIVMVFFLVMVFTYLLHPVNIVGHSMYPTLNKDDDPSDPATADKVFMSTVYGKIKYGDILVIDNNRNFLLDDDGNAYLSDSIRPLNECIIKRAIATEGQTIDISEGKVVVDGVEINEPYIAAGSVTSDLGAFTEQYPITVPEGYVFVMGDNREHSTDSRAPQVGLVSKEQVYGKAVARYYPMSKFSILIGSENRSEN